MQKYGITIIHAHTFLPPPLIFGRGEEMEGGMGEGKVWALVGFGPNWQKGKSRALPTLLAPLVDNLHLLAVVALLVALLQLGALQLQMIAPPPRVQKRYRQIQ